MRTRTRILAAPKAYSDGARASMLALWPQASFEMLWLLDEDDPVADLDAVQRFAAGLVLRGRGRESTRSLPGISVRRDRSRSGSLRGVRGHLANPLWSEGPEGTLVSRVPAQKMPFAASPKPALPTRVSTECPQNRASPRRGDSGLKPVALSAPGRDRVPSTQNPRTGSAPRPLLPDRTPGHPRDRSACQWSLAAGTAVGRG